MEQQKQTTTPDNKTAPVTPPPATQKGNEHDHGNKQDQGNKQANPVSGNQALPSKDATPPVGGAAKAS